MRLDTQQRSDRLVKDRKDDIVSEPLRERLTEESQIWRMDSLSTMADEIEVDRHALDEGK